MEAGWLQSTLIVFSRSPSAPGPAHIRMHIVIRAHVRAKRMEKLSENIKVGNPLKVGDATSSIMVPLVPFDPGGSCWESFNRTP